jgi:hypothetical protein
MMKMLNRSASASLDINSTYVCKQRKALTGMKRVSSSGAIGKRATNEDA